MAEIESQYFVHKIILVCGIGVSFLLFHLLIIRAQPAIRVAMAYLSTWMVEWVSDNGFCYVQRFRRGWRRNGIRKTSSCTQTAIMMILDFCSGGWALDYQPRLPASLSPSPPLFFISMSACPEEFLRSSVIACWYFQYFFYPSKICDKARVME